MAKWTFPHFSALCPVLLDFQKRRRYESWTKVSVAFSSGRFVPTMFLFRLGKGDSDFKKTTSEPTLFFLNPHASVQRFVCLFVPIPSIPSQELVMRLANWSGESKLFPIHPGK